MQEALSKDRNTTVVSTALPANQARAPSPLQNPHSLAPSLPLHYVFMHSLPPLFFLKRDVKRPAVASFYVLLLISPNSNLVVCTLLCLFEALHLRQQRRQRNHPFRSTRFPPGGRKRPFSLPPVNASWRSKEDRREERVREKVQPAHCIPLRVY